jgi:hypothetical protein
MGVIEPVDPFEPLETDEVRAAAERVHAPVEPPARPDWLVGPDDGVEAERGRVGREAAGPAERPTLLRPESTPEEPPRRAEAEPVALRLPPRAAAPSKPVPEKPVAWAAAASSLPTLRVLKGGTPEAKGSPDARFAPELKLAARAPAAPLSGAPAGDDDADFPDEAGPRQAPSTSSAAPAVSARMTPPREAWWLVAADALRSDRKVQLLVGLLVVLGALFLFWPREQKSLSLSEIRRHPQAWDGRLVRVSGRVGEVFPVGGGFAFNLHQGRDTLVVFTRSRSPRTRDRVVISGSISTGWLDGKPRQALFEETAP